MTVAHPAASPTASAHRNPPAHVLSPTFNAAANAKTRQAPTRACAQNKLAYAHIGVPKAHHTAPNAAPPAAAPNRRRQKKQAHSRQRRRQRHRTGRHEVGKRKLSPRRFRINPHHPHRRPRRKRKGHGQKHQPRSFVGIVMSLEVCLVLRVLLVGVDLQRVPLDNRAQQVEAGVLIPSPAFIEIDERKKD